MELAHWLGLLNFVISVANVSLLCIMATSSLDFMLQILGKGHEDFIAINYLGACQVWLIFDWYGSDYAFGLFASKWILCVSSLIVDNLVLMNNIIEKFWFAAVCFVVVFPRKYWCMGQLLGVNWRWVYLHQMRDYFSSLLLYCSG